jgi:hypothetical protein
MDRLAFRTTPEVISNHQVFAALMLRRMVENHSHIGKTSDEEYASGIAYAAHKYKLPTDGGTLNITGMSAGHLAYIADLIAETIGQRRIADATMEVARNGQELEQSEKQERNETA